MAWSPWLKRLRSLLTFWRHFKNQPTRLYGPWQFAHLNELKPYNRLLELHMTAHPQPESRCMAILFVDISGYSRLMEQHPPDWLIVQLNEYFAAMTQVILFHNGRIDKYMGDEILAFFDMIDGQLSSSAYNAVKAALSMGDVLKRLNQKWKRQGRPPLAFRIGIHCGPVSVARMGSFIKMDQTLIGDTVNVASRLQELNKRFQSQILISSSTFDLIQHHLQARFHGTVDIEGREQPMDIYEPLSITTERLQWLSLNTPTHTDLE
jgi:adenylate cyclase